jgi:hypothetical protein
MKKTCTACFMCISVMSVLTGIAWSAQPPLYRWNVEEGHWENPQSWNPLRQTKTDSDEMYVDRAEGGVCHFGLQEGQEDAVASVAVLNNNQLLHHGNTLRCLDLRIGDEQAGGTYAISGSSAKLFLFYEYPYRAGSVHIAPSANFSQSGGEVQVHRDLFIGEGPGSGTASCEITGGTLFASTIYCGQEP